MTTKENGLGRKKMGSKKKTGSKKRAGSKKKMGSKKKESKKTSKVGSKEMKILMRIKNNL